MTFNVLRYIPSITNFLTIFIMKGSWILSNNVHVSINMIFSLYSLNVIYHIKKIYLFIYLSLAVLGLRFCVRAFSSCSERGLLSIAVHGPLTVAASPIAEHRLQMRRLSSCGSRP